MKFNWLFMINMNVFMMFSIIMPVVLFYDYSTVVEFYSSHFYFLNMCMIFDWISVIFVWMVSLISTLVILYSNDYMGEKDKNKFMMLMMSFIMSMYIMSMTGNLFWVMLGWDGLGITSFCLVMFFQNWKSFNSAMVTFMSNRMGDLFLIMSIYWLFCFGSMMSWLPNFKWIIGMLIMFTSLSKSAQVPFSAWLPLAMAAPTPVSALVHSSTLVTAGVFLMIRFSGMISNEVMETLTIFSCITIILAGISSIWEYDLKKVIALSTLLHVGFMMLFISIKDFKPAILHLVTHAMFKSLLFMVAGHFIHKFNNQQDIRYINISLDSTSLSMFIVSIASMMGIPFLTGFYSKELMMHSMLNSNTSILIIISFFMSVSFTCLYSIRLLTWVMHSKLNLMNSESNYIPFSMKMSIFIGCLLSTMMGSIFHWELMESMHFFSFTNGWMSALLLLIMVLSIITGIYTKTLSFKFATFFNSMLQINSLVKFPQLISMKISSMMWFCDIKGWIDYLFTNNTMENIFLMKKKFQLSNSPLSMSIMKIMMMLPLISMFMMYI